VILSRLPFLLNARAQGIPQGWQSGLSQTPEERSGVKALHEFKSRPLRSAHVKKRGLKPGNSSHFSAISSLTLNLPVCFASVRVTPI
jgi:hypothetical protein